MLAMAVLSSDPMDDNVSIVSSFEDLADSKHGDDGFSKPNPAPRRGRRMHRRHSVDFVPHSQVIEIDTPEEEQKTDIWYTRDEYDIIKARNSLIVKMMKTGNFEESDEHSFRGLEHKLKDGNKQRKNHKFDALNAVLEEQDRQYAREGRIIDLENIAKKYEVAASHAREIALIFGEKDAEEAGFRKEEDESEIILDKDDMSTVSDIDSVFTENTEQKRNRISKLFVSISEMKRNKARRRASM
jgi:hypothetical protein